MTTIKVRCVRPCYAGAPLRAGEVIDATPIIAADLLASGRCELVQPADRAAVGAAIVEHRDRLLAGLRAADQRAAESWVLRRRRA